MISIFPADGLTYSFGIFYNEFISYFNEGRGYTAWIISLLVGITLCSGKLIFKNKAISILRANFSLF